MLRAPHAVMDGQGTLAWAQDIVRCLGGRGVCNSTCEEVQVPRRPSTMPLRPAHTRGWCIAK